MDAQGCVNETKSARSRARERLEQKPARSTEEAGEDAWDSEPSPAECLRCMTVQECVGGDQAAQRQCRKALLAVPAASVRLHAGRSPIRT